MLAMASNSYLAQALRAMSDQQPAANPVAAPDPMAMKQQIDQINAWKAANPGQSYLGNQVRDAGQNLMAAPGRMGAALGAMFGADQAPPPSPLPAKAQSGSGILGLAAPQMLPAKMPGGQGILGPMPVANGLPAKMPGGTGLLGLGAAALRGG